MSKTGIDAYTYSGPKLDLLSKSRWITALLDGSFTQGRKTLCKVPTGTHGGKRTPRHCCLGVKAVIDGGTFLDNGRDSFDSIVGHNFRALRFVSASGVDFGVTSMYFEGVPGGGEVTCPDGEVLQVASFLANANDKHQWSFKKIAAWIDKNL